VVYEKPASLVKCDYVWKRTDRWINFPWSSLPPVLPGVLDRLTAGPAPAPARPGLARPGLTRSGSGFIRLI